MSKDRIEAAVRCVRVLVVGGINQDLMLEVDRVPDDDGTAKVAAMTWSAGGHAANCATAAAALGARVQLIGVVGEDAIGTSLREGLSRAGIDVSGVHVDSKHPTGMAVIPTFGSSHRYMLMHRGANDAEPDWGAILDKADIDGTDVLVMFDPALGLAAKILRIFNDGYTGRSIWAPGGLWASRPEFRVNAASVSATILNQAEFVQVFGRPWSPADAPAPLRAGGELIVTGGARGSWLVGDAGVTFAPTVPVDAVDETGAGDAFVAAFAIFCAVDKVPIFRVLDLANAAGALATMHHGARIEHLSVDGILGFLGDAGIACRDGG